jgi:glyoxylase-like metal-dependent hydrolase (beta-lactamase superfamily II)
MEDSLHENFRFQVGNFEIISLTDATAILPAQKMFPTVSEIEWQEYHHMYPTAFKGLDTWTGRISCNLIRTPEQLILVDTGLGPASTAFAQFLQTSGKLPLQLEKENIKADDIDLVFLTHLHADHVGWNTSAKDQQPIFTNARYLASKADWDFSRNRLEKEPQKSGYIHENILPLKEQERLQLIDEEIVLASGVKTFYTPGHTPGHMSIKIEADNGKIVWLLGDAAAHPLQITEPSHKYAFDNDPETAVQTRAKLIECIETEGGIVGACHFPQPGFGRIIYEQSRRYWQAL